MKRYTPTLLAMMVLVLPGCLDVNVRTVVSSDGSSERTISLKTNSRVLPEGAFPVPLDSTWSVEWKETGQKDQAYEYVARKTFRTPEDLHREYAGRRDTAAVALGVSIEKRFRWFYTYLDYREVYSMRNSINNVPVTDFLTKDEIERYVRGEKSDSLKRKVELWDTRNLFEEFYRPLLEEVTRRNDPALPPSLLTAKKEELFRGVIEADSAQKQAKMKDSTLKEPEPAQFLLTVAAKVLGTRSVMSLEPVVNAIWLGVEAKEAAPKRPDTWTCALQMPGLLLGTNSTSVEGNLVTWNFTADQIHVGNYSMEASSRVANVWAFVLTGIAALAVVGMGIIPAFRKSRR